MQNNRGVLRKLIIASASGLVLSGCTIGPLTLPDLPNPFAQQSQSGPEISTTSEVPAPTATATDESTIDVSTLQQSRTINATAGQKITFVNRGKIDLNLILTLEREIPITIVAGGEFGFNFPNRDSAKISWNGVTITMVNSEPVPTRATVNE